MEYKNFIMNQLVFKFPFKKKYYEQDFYVSSNNFNAYKLIENWPNWPRERERERERERCIWSIWFRKNTFIKNIRKKKII